MRNMRGRRFVEQNDETWIVYTWKK